MRRNDGDWSNDLAAGIVGLGILLLFILAFWWFKGLATVLRAFDAEPGNRPLWAATIASLILGVLAVLSQGNAIVVVLAIASCMALYLIAYRIVQRSSVAAGSPRSLDDVIRMRW